MTKDQNQFYGFFEPLIKGHNQFIDFENHQSRAYYTLPSFPSSKFNKW
jgi:hypothetical protein